MKLIEKVIALELESKRLKMSEFINSCLFITLLLGMLTSFSNLHQEYSFKSKYIVNEQKLEVNIKNVKSIENFMGYQVHHYVRG